MQAALYEAFRQPLQLREFADLEPRPDAVILAVQACGICRSDWHAWMGHDATVGLPNVPGHEIAGTILALGDDVRRWSIGQRVTVPFCCGCGTCLPCRSGQSHICDADSQPGFTHWGAFAEQVEIRCADFNLVALPEAVDSITAASLGCRFATSFRAVIQQGRTTAGDWVAVHGCGGVGLSAVMIAKALGAHVVAVDIRRERLDLAKRLGADVTVEANGDEVPDRIRAITGRGAQVSLDALGHHQTCWNSIACLDKRGRHIQVGLTMGDAEAPPIPMSLVVAKELELLGSHGMQPFHYDRMLAMIADGTLRPDRLISDVVSLQQGAQLLTQLDQFPNPGITVIEIESSR